MNEETLEYRLKNIEDTLVELKNVVVENRLQQKDIDEMKKFQSETRVIISERDERIKGLDDRIKELENAPAKRKSSKWDTAMDIIYKIAITAGMGLILAKVGLQGGF